MVKLCFFNEEKGGFPFLRDDAETEDGEGNREDRYRERVNIFKPYVFGSGSKENVEGEAEFELQEDGKGTQEILVDL